LITI
jgi:hypothetical protein